MSEADRGSRRVTGWRKRLRVVLVLAVILVILNGYALFMKGDIEISEQLLDQLSTVEGETLKQKLEDQYGCSDIGLYYRDAQTGEFCRIDECESEFSIKKGIEFSEPTRENYTGYFLWITFYDEDQPVVNRNEGKNYASNAYYERITLKQSITGASEPWGYCDINFQYHTPHMDILYVGSDPWGKSDKIEEQIRWLIDQGSWNGMDASNCADIWPNMNSPPQRSLSKNPSRFGEK